MNYSYTKKSDLDFGQTVLKVKEELQKEGFGVLCEIDVRTTMKKKLNLDYENYTILGACNPVLANQALEAEKQIGLFLPCNVIVYQENQDVFVATVLPEAMLSAIDNPALNEIAQSAEEKLKRVVDNL